MVQVIVDFNWHLWIPKSDFCPRGVCVEVQSGKNQELGGIFITHKDSQGFYRWCNVLSYTKKVCWQHIHCSTETGPLAKVWDMMRNDTLILEWAIIFQRHELMRPIIRPIQHPSTHNWRYHPKVGTYIGSHAVMKTKFTAISSINNVILQGNVRNILHANENDLPHMPLAQAWDAHHHRALPHIPETGYFQHCKLYSILKSQNNEW